MALGAYTHPDGLESEQAQKQLITGKQLAYTCYQMYVESYVYSSNLDLTYASIELQFSSRHFD